MNTDGPLINSNSTLLNNHTFNLHTPTLHSQKPEEMRITFDVEKKFIGKVLGRGGATIQSIQAVSGTRVQIDQTVDPARVQIEGDEKGVWCTKSIILDIAASQFKGFAFLRQAGQFVERVSVDPMQSDVCPPSAVYVCGRGYTPYEQIADIHPPIGYHPPKVQTALHTFYQLRPQTIQNAKDYHKHKTLGGMLNSPSSTAPIPPFITSNISALPHQLLGSLQQQLTNLSTQTPTPNNYSPTPTFQNPNPLPLTLTSAPAAADSAAINQSLLQQKQIDQIADMLAKTGLTNNTNCCLGMSSPSLDGSNACMNGGNACMNGGNACINNNINAFGGYLLDRFQSTDMQSVESSASMVSPLQAQENAALLNGFSQELKLNLVNQWKFNNNNNNINNTFGGCFSKGYGGGLYGLDAAQQIESETMCAKLLSEVAFEQKNNDAQN